METYSINLIISVSSKLKINKKLKQNMRMISIILKVIVKLVKLQNNSMKKKIKPLLTKIKQFSISNLHSLRMSMKTIFPQQLLKFLKKDNLTKNPKNTPLNLKAFKNFSQINKKILKNNILSALKSINKIFVTIYLNKKYVVFCSNTSVTCQHLGSKI